MTDEYRWFLADLRTGGEVVDLPGVMAGSTWSQTLNQPETLRADVNMAAEEAFEFNVRAHTVPGRVMLGCATGDTIHGLGPIWTRRYARSRMTATLTARGIWSYFDHRFVHTLLAAAAPLDTFTVPSFQNEGQQEANPELRSTFGGLGLGTIVKRLIQQAQAHTGGEVPVVFDGSVELGSWWQVNDALEFANLGQVLRDITRLRNGIDVRFEPRFADGGHRVEFLLRTGTGAEPLLTGGPHYFDLAAGDPNGSGLVAEDDASGLASRGWATGGRSGDRVLIARDEDPYLLDLGFALFESLDSSHSSEDTQEVLNEYAAELTAARGPQESWSFDAERDADAPRFTSLRVGDWVSVVIPEWDPVTLHGDPWYREGLDNEERRIVGLEGVHGSRTVTVTTSPKKE